MKEFRILCLCMTMLLYCIHTFSQESLLEALHGMGSIDHTTIENESENQTYHLLVKKPIDYNPDVIYPVVYLLDGGITFPLFASYGSYLYFGGEVPNVILVGISYGTDDYEKGNARGHDYTVPSIEREHYGGAQDFANFLKGSIFSYIESRYSCDLKKRVIFGQSLGGQFVLYAAQCRSDLFWGHIASNPALHRNLDFFLTDADQSYPSDRKLFVSDGSENDERFRVPSLQWMDYWNAKRNKPWDLKTVSLDGLSHFSAVAESFRQGMAWIFAEE